MRGQFLFDMLVGWVIFTKEGKETANKVFNKAVDIAKENLKDVDLKSLLNSNVAKTTKCSTKKPTMDKQ